jgi:L-amino acid N-acyltransferase
MYKSETMIKVREAIESDLPQILEIYNEVILNTTAVYDYEPHSLEMRRQWFAAKKEQGFPVYVAEVGSEILGLSSIGPFRAWAAYQYSVENSVYVAARARGQGIGRLLIPPLITRARELGIHAMLAGIDAGNEASLRLHAYFGFREVAHFREVGWKFGRWLDLKFLELILQPAMTAGPGKN